MDGKMVPCVNCKGDGFITDLMAATVPCPVCQPDGEILGSDAVDAQKAPDRCH